MLLGTAEEWVVYNQSIDLYSVNLPDDSWTPEQQQEYIRHNPELLYYRFRYVDDPPDGAPTSPQPWMMGGNARYAYPMTPAQARDVNQRRRAVPGDPWTKPGELTITTRSVDHPFHMHQNPFWIIRVEVPDENGDLVNILPEPRWADVVALPRNGGRVALPLPLRGLRRGVREPLPHPPARGQRDDAACRCRERRSRIRTTSRGPAWLGWRLAMADVDGLYGRPTPAESWAQSLYFVDGNATGYVHPGEAFRATPPVPPTT